MLEKQLDSLSEKIEQLISQNQEWRMKTEILTSEPGVGKVMAYTLLCELPELGSLNGRDIAALV